MSAFSRPLAVLLVAFGLLACSKKEEALGAPSASASAAASQVAVPTISATTSSAAAVPVTLPSEKDEAAAAAKEIDAKNYKKELETLEAQLK